MLVTGAHLDRFDVSGTRPVNRGAAAAATDLDVDGVYLREERLLVADEAFLKCASCWGFVRRVLSIVEEDCNLDAMV